MTATTTAARRRSAWTGWSALLPYALLAPALLVLLAVFLYPLLDGLRTSTELYRFGRPIDSVGLQNYKDALADPEFRHALLVTLRFVALAVVLETALGLLLALACVEQLRFVRSTRALLILPMVLMPVVVGIVFRLLYASDVGLFTTVAGTPVQLLSEPGTAFLAVVAVDVWEWTPLMFLILLAGLQSLPVEPLEAARVDGAGRWRTFFDHTLPMLRPILAIAVVLRTADAFTTFDQVFVLTRGGPGDATKLISLFGYETAFKFQQVGYASAMLLMVGLLVVALVLLIVRTLRRQEAV